MNRTTRRHTAAIILSLVALCGLQGAHAMQARECFRVFDGMNHTGKPSFIELGLSPTVIVASSQYFWPRGADLGQALPAKSAVDSAVRQWMKSTRPALFVIDLEHWPNVGEDKVVAASVDKYVTVFDWVKAGTGQAPVGYYGIPPVRDYWRATKGEASSAYGEWQRDNDRFRRLANTVDVLLPSLYTFYEHPQGWESYAIENVKEARRLAQGKPVYPFIWPLYHSGKLKGQQIPAEFWRLQLKTMERIADGVVIWYGDRVRWNEDAEWWQVTKEFIQSSSRACKSDMRPQPPRDLETARDG